MGSLEGSVFSLHGINLRNIVDLPQCLYRALGQTNIPCLSGLADLIPSKNRLFKRSVRINPVKIVEVGCEA
jgi:hypothetical protein